MNTYMDYKPTGSDERLKATEPPLYATKIPSRSPALKYQRKGHAKVAMRMKMGAKHRYNGQYYVSEMYLFKYDESINDYKLIFDSFSELADACRKGDITPEELLDRIAW